MFFGLLGGIILVLFFILPLILGIEASLTGYSRWLLKLGPIASLLGSLGVRDINAAADVLVAILVALILLHWVMLSVLVIILMLRKVVAFMQFRLGPRRVGFRGAAQTLADAIKLMVKEDVIPAKADRWIFTAAPIIVFVPALLIYIVVPWGAGNGFIARDLNIGVLYTVAITSVAVVGIIMAGWASDNKYALLGAMRSAAQLVSYEVPAVIAVLGPVILAQSLSMQAVVKAQDGWFWKWFFFNPPLLGAMGFVSYLISGLAETSTTPFDLPEAESELVAGYNTEYSGMKFAFFFLAEFSNTFAISGIAAALFWGGWQAPLPFLPDGGWFGVFWFFLKTCFGVFFFMWARATWPRVRVDQLMEFAWKFVVPMAIVYVMGVAFLVAKGWF
jgi:NADH-quinone oxidoreductase subunit H